MHVFFVLGDLASEDFESSPQFHLLCCSVDAVLEELVQGVEDLDDVTKGYRDQKHGGWSWGFFGARCGPA